ncbi:MAG: RDD family protein [Candidatus Accumulibacter sp.]|nr:RDD family protein [Accumulibacter sp.]
MTPAALILLPLMIEAVAGGSSRFAFGMLALLAIAATLLLPFFLDACLVGLFGNSLGKALLGIRVTRKDGCQPGFSDILKRNLYVWGYGYWTGLMPLVSWIPMLMAYRSLTGEKGETKWDAVLGYDVHRTPVGAARIFVFVLSFMVTVLVANLTELTTAHVLSRLASKVGANGNRQSAKLLSDEEVGIKPPTSQPRPGPFDDLIPKKTESGRSEPRFSQSQGWGPWMAQRSVEEISRVAKEYEPRLNDPRAWAAVVAWQSAFIQHWNRLANTAMYDAVGMVSAGLNGNQGICSPDPGDVTIMDAAHATAAMPAGTKSIGYKCAR